MKNNLKSDSSKIKIELLLRKALSVKQEPSRQLNDSIIKKYEEYSAKVVDTARGCSKKKYNNHTESSSGMIVSIFSGSFH